MHTPWITDFHHWRVSTGIACNFVVLNIKLFRIKLSEMHVISDHENCQVAQKLANIPGKSVLKEFFKIT